LSHIRAFHGRGDEHGRGERGQQRAHQVVGDAPAIFPMIFAVAGATMHKSAASVTWMCWASVVGRRLPQAGQHLAPGERLKREGAHELAGRALIATVTPHPRCTNCETTVQVLYAAMPPQTTTSTS